MRPAYRRGHAEDSTRSTIDGRRPRPSGKKELCIMSLRKPLAASAAVMAAFAVAGPATNASAATVPTARTASIGHFMAGPLACRIMVGELRFAMASGNTLWADGIARVLQYSGCGGAAI
jgi:hypothetical protein